MATAALGQKALVAQPTLAFILGITLTMGSLGEMRFSKNSTVFPAAIDMMRGAFAISCSFMGFTASSRTLGLTASTKTSAAATTSADESHLLTPQVFERFSAASGKRS